MASKNFEFGGWKGPLRDGREGQWMGGSTIGGGEVQKLGLFWSKTIAHVRWLILNFTFTFHKCLSPLEPCKIPPWPKWEATASTPPYVDAPALQNSLRKSWLLFWVCACSDYNWTGDKNLSYNVTRFEAHASTRVIKIWATRFQAVPVIDSSDSSNLSVFIIIIIIITD